jgi:hypothetical protein
MNSEEEKAEAIKQMKWAQGKLEWFEDQFPEALGEIRKRMWELRDRADAAREILQLEMIAREDAGALMCWEYDGVDSYFKAGFSPDVPPHTFEEHFHKDGRTRLGCPFDPYTWGEYLD